MEFILLLESILENCLSLNRIPSKDRTGLDKIEIRSAAIRKFTVSRNVYVVNQVSHEGITRVNLANHE